MSEAEEIFEELTPEEAENEGEGEISVDEDGVTGLNPSGEVVPPEEIVGLIKDGTVFRPNLSMLLDEAEISFQLTQSVTSVEGRLSSYVSTGLLADDLFMGGGLLPGAWVTYFGGEQSAKSTKVSTLTASALDQEIPVALFDYEGSMDPYYFGSIVNTLLERDDLTDAEIFGEQNNKGQWTTPPKVRLYTESVGEKFFDSMASVLRRLPDKVYMDGTWYFVYDFTRENQKLFAGMYSQALFKRNKRFYIPAPNGLPQLLIIVDSYPNMFPKGLDADDKNAGMAALARMFAANIPKIAGKLKEKCVTVVGVNQLRERPATMYGSPEYEPAGAALKFTSSIRVKQSKCSVPHDSGAIWLEPSLLTEGSDSYSYIKQKTIKNKTYKAQLTITQRVWTSDGEGVAHGFCPVQDVYMFLRCTGLYKGTYKSGTLKMLSPDGEVLYSVAKCSFMMLKKLYFLKGEELKAYCKKIGINVAPRLRDRCKDLLKSRLAFDLMFEQQRNTTKVAD